MWQESGRALVAAAAEDDGRRRKERWMKMRRTEVGPKLPRLIVLHCSRPLRPNRGPPENQLTPQPGERGMKRRGGEILKGAWRHMCNVRTESS